MSTIIDKTEFRVIYDSFCENGNKLLDSIISNNIQNRDAIIKTIKQTQDKTYSSHYNKIEKYINIPIEYEEKPYNPIASFEVIQQWEGYVQDVNEDNGIFTATLLDITSEQSYPSEEADFKINDVDNFDLHFLRNGAVFRWVIGYKLERKEKKGRISVTKISSSNLVFRRIRWNETSLKQADKKAKEFKDEIIWE